MSGLGLLLGADAGASGPTTLILDQFTDANGTALSSHTIGPTNTPATVWSVTTGLWQIQSNQCRSVANSNVAILVCDPGVSNYTVSAVVTATSEDVSSGVIARYQDSSNFWLAAIDGSPGDLAWNLYECVSGTFHSRASGSATGIVAGSPVTISLQVSGTSLTATCTGLATLSFTSSDFQTSTKAGLRGPAFAQNVNFDNFTVTVP